MNPFELYPQFALSAILCWLVASVFAFHDRRKLFYAVYGLGILIYSVFIAWLWIESGRPPMRSMGETRIWYSFFLSVTGLLVYLVARYSWLPAVATLLASVFASFGIFKPELFSTTLMPALRSVWFVPHVTVYIFSYAIMSIALLSASFLWYSKRYSNVLPSSVMLCNNLVRIGWALLTAGMIMGSLWAKEAWGDFWSWDPKETWAFLTWLSYLLYIHLATREVNRTLLLVVMIFSFLLLQMCWYGVNYLPSASSSIHVY